MKREGKEEISGKSGERIRENSKKVSVMMAVIMLLLISLAPFSAVVAVDPTPTPTTPTPTFLFEFIEPPASPWVVDVNKVVNITVNVRIDAAGLTDEFGIVNLSWRNETSGVVENYTMYMIANNTWSTFWLNVSNVTTLAAGNNYTYKVYASDIWNNTGVSVKRTVNVTAVAESDLIVEAITPKCGYMFANETNNITATIKNNGGADAGAFNVGFDIAGAVTKVSVSGLAAGATTTVYVVDTTSRNVGDSVAITVTADCDGAISESNETNNVMSKTFTVYNNGYKGKTYTGGANMTTWKTFELKGSLLYSVGDSYYLSGYYGWATASYTVNWTASDLPVPAGATVKEARLYVPYTFDYADDIPTNVSLMFNGATKTFEAHYTDRKGFPKDYGKYGMLVYNVTDDFNANGNNATLTNSNWDKKTVSIRGMVLVVVYAYDSEPKRAIFMNEEFDMLYGGESKCTTPEEATAYAPFSGLTVDTANVTSAKLITVAPGAGPNEGELIFNGHKWTDVWNFAGATQIGIAERNVINYLEATDNEAAFQSSADWMEASNAFLVVGYEEVPPPEHAIKVGDYTLELYNSGEVIVPVEILNAGDIAGGSAKITFNASVVKVKAVSAGHFGMPQANIDNTNGFVYVAASRAFAAGREEAVLANLLFSGVSEGYTTLDIHDAHLNFEDGNTTIPATISGSITVETRMLGDLNRNNMMDTGDATLVLRMVVGLSEQDMLGDMNRNGMIDTGDATLILRRVVGL